MITIKALNKSERYLEALCDDRLLLDLPSSEIKVQRVEQPGEELHRVALLLNHKALLAACHDRLHELVRADLEGKNPRMRG